jgi:hypothetical protein
MQFHEGIGAIPVVRLGGGVGSLQIAYVAYISPAIDSKECRRRAEGGSERVTSGGTGVRPLPSLNCERRVAFTAGSVGRLISMSPSLNINVFTAPEKEMVAERVRPFGPPPAFDPSTSTLIFGEHDAVLVDTLLTVAEAEALANWVALHHRNLATIYITHGHFDHFAGLSVLLQRFPEAQAISKRTPVASM